MLENKKRLSLIGGLVGLVLFLLVGLLPSMLYGGYAGLALATAFGLVPIVDFLMAKLLILFCMTVFTLAVAGIFVIFSTLSVLGVNQLLLLLNANNKKCKEI